MNLSKTQLIIFGVVGVIILFVLFGFLGVIPGIKKEKSKSFSSPLGESNKETELTVWLFGEEEKNFSNFISNFQSGHNTKVFLRTFGDYNSYFNSLLQAMAEGKGPDIFNLPSTEIPVFLNKIYPLPLANLPLVKLNSNFPQVVVKDVVFKNSIYGLPLSLDTLVLIYNRDIFSKAGIVFPPADWKSFTTILGKLTIKDEKGDIVQAGAALGSPNVDESADILYSIILQLGGKIVEEGKVNLTNKESQIAFKFFRQFADPNKEYFTWNKNMPRSFDAFADNKVAMIFGYNSSLKLLKAKNSFLNMEIAPFPQLSTSTAFVVHPRYTVFTVSKQTKNPFLAWEFITSLTLNSTNADAYVKSSGNPPALLELVNKYLNDPYLSVFSKQALYAKSWYGPNRNALDEVIRQTIGSFLDMQDENNLENLLTQAQNKMTTIISNLY